MNNHSYKVGDAVMHAAIIDSYCTVEQVEPDQILLKGNFSPVDTHKWCNEWEKIRLYDPHWHRRQMVEKPTSIRPPRGVMKRRFQDEARFTELQRAIRDFAEHWHPINPEWITEYNEIVKRFEQHGNNMY